MCHIWEHSDPRQKRLCLTLNADLKTAIPLDPVASVSRHVREGEPVACACHTLSFPPVGFPFFRTLRQRMNLETESSQSDPPEERGGEHTVFTLC